MNRQLPFAYIGRSFEGLSTPVRDYNEMLDLSGLSKARLEIGTLPMIDPITRTECTDAFRTYANHIDPVGGTSTYDPLGVVGPKYAFMHPSEHLVGVEVIMELFPQAKVIAAGMTGSKYWAAMHLGDKATIRIAGTDDISVAYVTIVNACDGTMSLTYLDHNHRIVCRNTFKMAWDESVLRKSALRPIKNTASIAERRDEANRNLPILLKGIAEFNEVANYLASVKVNTDFVKTVMKGLFPQTEKESTRTKNQVEQMLRRIDSNDNNAIPQIRGTAWNLFNGISEFFQYDSTVKVGPGIADHLRSEAENRNRAESVLFGTIADKNALAMDLIIAEAKGLSTIAPGHGSLVTVPSGIITL